MPITPNGPAPYPPTGKVIDVVLHHRKQGLVTPVTTDVIERVTGTPGLAPRVAKALQLFDLVDAEGQPTEQFDELAKAPTEDEFKERFASTLRAAYADVFQYIDPATATYEQIEGQFRNYTPRGQLGRMVALFRGLCEYTGIMSPGAAEPTAPKPRKAPTAHIASAKAASRAAAAKRGRQGGEPETNHGGAGISEAKSRYLDLLLTMAQTEPSSELLDRIEKVLGIASAPQPSAQARGQGDDAARGGESD